MQPTFLLLNAFYAIGNNVGITKNIDFSQNMDPIPCGQCHHSKVTFKILHTHCLEQITSQPSPGDPLIHLQKAAPLQKAPY